ncbi:MAG: ferrous iron transporter B [Maricaulaceae bacterium]
MSATALRIALVGAPNCGKSTLFNGLTGGQAKVANYPGVTVERREGAFRTPGGRDIALIDLPGVYGLAARSKDAEVAIDALAGRIEGQPAPDALVVLIDASHLRTHLHTVLELRALGRPMMVALNMFDLAERDGVKIDIDKLQAHLGVPVVHSRATRAAGRVELLERIDEAFAQVDSAAAPVDAQLDVKTLTALQREARAIAHDVIIAESDANKFTRAVDSVVLHPIGGLAILVGLLFAMFQAVYAWSATPMGWTEVAIGYAQGLVSAAPLPGWASSLLSDGLLAGVGAVVVFLPQIVILFAFILALEASGYMARAAFLTDDLMSKVGLNGRAVIPLLSGFACAIPGIMAARAIEGERDRLTTILITPLMTCSARLPVYTLIVGAFIPNQAVGPVNLQGLVLFGLYMSGVVMAILVAFVLKRTVAKGRRQGLLLELPTYKLPDLSTYLRELRLRAWAFLKRAGTIILGVTIVLWLLASFPEGEQGVRGSFAGQIGAVLHVILAPIGFNLEIAIALVPGMAAREVAVAALGTVYSLQGGEEAIAQGLVSVLQSAWSLPTALAFLAWYVFAPQCLSTLAVARRETNSWGWTLFMFGYLFALAYIAAGATYWIAKAAGL